MKRPLLLAAVCLGFVPSVAGAQSFFQFIRELRVGGMAMNSARVSALSGDPSLATGTGTLGGFEGFFRMDVMGVRIRQVSGHASATGQDPSGPYTEHELALIVGPRAFALEGGVFERTTTTIAGAKRVQIPRVGVRSQWYVVGRQVQVNLAGAIFFDEAKTTLTEMNSLGHDAEASLLVQPVLRIPVYVQGGFRYERLLDPGSTVRRVDETNSYFLGIGVRIARNGFQ